MGDIRNLRPNHNTPTTKPHTPNNSNNSTQPHAPRHTPSRVEHTFARGTPVRKSNVRTGQLDIMDVMGGPSHLVKLRQGAHLRGAGTETIDRSSSTRGVAWRSTGSRLAVSGVVLVLVLVLVSGPVPV